MASDGPGSAGHRYFLGALPFLIMAAIVAADLLQGPSDEFLPVLSLGPALACVSRRAVPTALIGALALGVGFVLAAYDNLYYSRRGVTALITIFGVTVACVVASAIRQRRERELADVRAVAEIAQQVLLRPVPGHVPSLDIAVRYVSASAAAQIGGDLYEVVTTASVTRFILGDVQGKGLPAVRTASVVLGAFREAAYDAVDLPEIAARIELSLRHQAATEEFVTAVIAQIAAGGDVIEVLDCGHPPPLLVRDGVVSLIEDPDPGLPLGLGDLAVSRRIAALVRLEPGDQILCYTDGISEARDKTGTFYPLHERAGLLGDGDLDDALVRLSADVTRYVGRKLDDDAAMLLIRHSPERAPVSVPDPGAGESLLA
jgi:serine phosphatase RsbU (regulator of sigma subunit)